MTPGLVLRSGCLALSQEAGFLGALHLLQVLRGVGRREGLRVAPAVHGRHDLLPRSAVRGLARPLKPLDLVVLQDRNLSVLSHPLCELRLRRLDRVRKVVPPAHGLVKGPVLLLALDGAEPRLVAPAAPEKILLAKGGVLGSCGKRGGGKGIEMGSVRPHFATAEGERRHVPESPRSSRKPFPQG